MKLVELYDETPVISNQDIGNLQKPLKKDIIAQGAFSSVQASDDPHAVDKTSLSKDKAKKDPFWHYATWIIENKLNQDNPCFPRFYDVKKFTYKDGSPMYKAQIEKLYDLDELNTKEKQYVAQRYFGAESYEQTPLYKMIV